MSSKHRTDDQRPNGALSVALPSVADGWCWTTLSEISDIEGGITKDQKRRVTGGMREVPYLRVANVQRGYLDLGQVKSIFADEDEVKALRLQKGDILFTEGGDRDKLGRGWVWNDEIEECIHQNHIFRARPHLPFVDPKFVSYHGNYFGQDWFTKTGKQTTNLASINKGVLSRFPVPLAPINEQRRIVAKIEELFSDLDAGVVALERVRANLKRYRAAVLKAAVDGKLTEDWRAHHPDTEPAFVLLERILIDRHRKWEQDQLARFAQAGKQPPKGWREKFPKPVRVDVSELPRLPLSWCWVAVDQVIGFLRNGLSQKPTGTSGGHRILRINAVRPLSVDLNEVRYFSQLPCEAQGYLIEDGDILFTRYNGSVELLGVSGMVRGCSEPTLHPDKLIRVKTVLGEPFPSFLEIASNVGVSRQHMERRARTTAGQTGISGTDIREMPLPVPPLDEQKQIVQEVERRLSIVDEIEAQIVANLKRAARLRQGILKRAFEGRLVPQDPTDEPAREILERIRQQQNTDRSGNGSSHTRRRGRRGKDGDAESLFIQGDFDDQGGDS